MPQAAKYPLEAAVHQSPKLDLDKAADDAWVKGKTILITGGASGFGEGYFRRWAGAGATVVIGDINVKNGDQLVRDGKKQEMKGCISSIAMSRTGQAKFSSSKRRSK